MILILFFLDRIFKSVKAQIVDFFLFFIDKLKYQGLSTLMDKINIAKIVIGTWALGGDYWGNQSHSSSLKTLHAAIREGFDSFDTAPVYGKGKSEQLLGQQFRHNNNIIYSTKCFTKPIEQIKKSINSSLQRLNRDYIDFFFLHWPSSKYSFEPALEYLEKEREKGKIKYIGLSNFNKEQLTNALNYSEINIVQNGFNLFWINDIEYFNFCKSKGIVTQAYSPLAQGLLTGKFTSKNPYIPRDMRQKTPLFQKEILEKLYPYIEQLSTIALENKLKPIDLSLIWALKNIDSIVVGCRTRSQIETLSKIKNCSITNKALKDLNKISIEVNNITRNYKNIFNHIY